MTLESFFDAAFVIGRLAKRDAVFLTDDGFVHQPVSVANPPIDAVPECEHDKSQERA